MWWRPTDRSNRNRRAEMPFYTLTRPRARAWMMIIMRIEDNFTGDSLVTLMSDATACICSTKGKKDTEREREIVGGPACHRRGRRRFRRLARRQSPVICTSADIDGAFIVISSHLISSRSFSIARTVHLTRFSAIALFRAHDYPRQSSSSLHNSRHLQKEVSE